MGAHSKAKAFLMTSFAKCFLNELDVVRLGLRMAPVVIFDITYIIKYSNDKWRKGTDFVWRSLIQEFNCCFHEGASVVYLCFDRGSPKNKWMEHQKRAKGASDAFQIPTTKAEVATIVTESKEHTKGRTFVVYGGRKNDNGDELSSTVSQKKDALCDDDDDDDDDDIDVVNVGDNVTVSLNDPTMLLVMRDDRLPSKENWTKTWANPFLKKQMMHYITCALVKDTSDPETLYTSGVFCSADQDYTYTPPPGKILCLHGGYSYKPNFDGTMSVPTEDVDTHHRRDVPTTREHKNLPFQPDDFLIVIGSSEWNKLKSSDPRITSTVTYDQKKYHRLVETHASTSQDHPRTTLRNLKEGELACTYYSNKRDSDDQLIISGDGDMISILLLSSKERLLSQANAANDRTTSFNFKNSIFLMLRLPKIISAFDSSDGRQKKIKADTYIDINLLYESISAHATFGLYKDPVATYLAVVALMGNDYIKGFAGGLAGGQSTDGTPWLYQPLIHNAKKYRNMIQIVLQYRSEDEHGSIASGSQRKYKVRLDEALFSQYALECYYYKYRNVKSVEKSLSRNLYLTLRDGKHERNAEIKNATLKNLHEYPELLNLAIKTIRSHLADKSTKNVMMDDDEIRGHGRRLLWLLDYWSNAYVENCVCPDPCQTTSDGKSVFGWCTPNDNPSACVPTDDICDMERVYSQKWCELDDSQNENNNNDDDDDDGMRVEEKEEKEDDDDTIQLARFQVRPAIVVTGPLPPLSATSPNAVTDDIMTTALITETSPPYIVPTLASKQTLSHPTTTKRSRSEMKETDAMKKKLALPATPAKKKARVITTTSKGRKKNVGSDSKSNEPVDGSVVIDKLMEEYEEIMSSVVPKNSRVPKKNSK